MLNNKTLLGSLIVFISLTACGLVKSSQPGPTALPSPANQWTVQMSQTGGIAGVNMTVKVSNDGQLRAEDKRSGRSATATLTPEVIATLRQLVSAALVPSSKTQLSSCADCFVYDLEIQAGSSDVTIRADDITLNDYGAATLITLLRTVRDNALASQP